VGENRVTKEDVLNALRNVIDYEINLDVVSLGLIYDVQIRDDNSVYIKMTMTTPMCPITGLILSDVENTVRSIPGVKDVEVELTFDPPWSPDMIDPEVRKALGI